MHPGCKSTVAGGYLRATLLVHASLWGINAAQHDDVEMNACVVHVSASI
jgi:hypothetical protein